MNLENISVVCPYCGEAIDVQVETMAEEQSYIEDCSVCCRPIQFEVTPGEDAPQVVVTRSD